MFADSSWSGSAYCWRRLQAGTGPLSVRCWAIVASAGQYPFSSSQYFMLAGERAHSPWRAATDSEMKVPAYFTSVHIYCFLEGMCQAKESTLTPAKRQYILDLQVSTYSLLQHS